MNTQQAQQILSPGAENMVNLLEQMGFTDPRLRLIAGIMDQQKSVETESQSAEKSPLERIESSNEIERTIEENELLKEENALLMDRIDMLTSALGICPDCLGEDTSCEICHGEGAPGNNLPDKEMFTKYVLPVISKLRRHAHKNRRIQSNNVGENKVEKIVHEQRSG